MNPPPGWAADWSVERARPGSHPAARPAPTDPRHRHRRRRGAVRSDGSSDGSEHAPANRAKPTGAERQRYDNIPATTPGRDAGDQRGPRGLVQSAKYVTLSHMTELTERAVIPAATDALP